MKLMFLRDATCLVFDQVTVVKQLPALGVKLPRKMERVFTLEAMNQGGIIANAMTK